MFLNPLHLTHMPGPVSRQDAACSGCPHAGKLDWVLLRGLRVAGQAVGNNEYALSDHKWLSADVAFD